MISVAEALANVLALSHPVETETIALRNAMGRVLADPVTATRDQPPFAASVMDGYALNAAGIRPGARFRLIGTAAAGARFDGTVGDGECVRIFTGAPVPDGADRVVIQEDTDQTSDGIELHDDLDPAAYIRPPGADFRKGQTLDAPRRLTAADLALIAAMNAPRVTVRRKPVVALLATGDELVMPGDTPGPDQIIASNTFALAAMAEAAGATARMLPIARDTTDALEQAFTLARGADLIVTVGGASVGDRDLVAPVAASMGMQQSFYKVAMRPGKPLMAGRMGDAAMLGLPGNPVSAIVCGAVFMLPMLAAMQGLPPEARHHQARLATALPANGRREHYMRARLDDGTITAADNQDSALLTVLASANALLIRPVGDPARQPGDTVTYLPL